MRHLFLFTITPVQDFISQSRKLKDLFGSSEILSCMSEIGMRICKREGGEIIFPYYDGENRQKSYPNRFLVEFKENKNFQKLGNEIKENLLKYLKGLNNLNHPKIQEHLKNYFTFYWAFSEKDNYKEAFDEVERLLAGAKNTRVFNQLGGGKGEQGRKCSICGERNVVVYNGKLPMPKEQIEIEKPIKSKITQIGEGLCGICYAKRVNSSKTFESTAEVALIHIFNKLKKDDYKHLKRDAQLFFEENLNEDYFEKNDIKEKLEDCKKDFEKFKKDLKNNNLKQTSYYSIVMFDGDSMGEWLSGKNLVDKSKLKSFHLFMSKKLIEFAGKTNDILKNKGIKVYAGGDDFLGFVNLNYLFEVLIDLKENWKKVVNNPLKKEFELKKNNFTFSAGVVIAHYKTPLGYVLQKVKEAEKDAKKVDDKDAITFSVLKRSGEIRKASIKFENLENIGKIQEILKGKSDSFISKLEKEFSLVDKPDRYLVMNELKRLLKKSEIDDSKLFDLLENVFDNFNDFLHLLNVIKFINREIG